MSIASIATAIPIAPIGPAPAVAQFPAEITRPPRSWVEAGYNLVRYTRFDRGGHFAALEEPDLLIGDLRAFARTLR